MIKQLKLVTIIVVLGVATLSAVYQLGKYQQRQQWAVDAAQAITKAIQSRADINETINNMDSVALCLELGGLRAECEQLRGLATDQP